MKKALIGTFLMLVAFGVHAQETKPEHKKLTLEQKAERLDKRMTEKLKLTPEQAAKLKPVNFQMLQKKEELKNSGLKGEEHQARLSEIETTYESQLASILTTSQMDEYRKMKAERKDKMKEHRKNMTPEQKAQKLTDRMSEKLNLTPEQKEKVLAINLETVKQKQEVKNSDLTPEERKSKIKTIREDYDRKLAEVLTKEQMSDYKKMREEHRKNPKKK